MQQTLLPYTWNSSPGLTFGGIFTLNTVVSTLPFSISDLELIVLPVHEEDWSFSVLSFFLRNSDGMMFL